MIVEVDRDTFEAALMAERIELIQKDSPCSIVFYADTELRRKEKENRNVF